VAVAAPGCPADRAVPGPGPRRVVDGPSPARSPSSAIRNGWPSTLSASDGPVAQPCRLVGVRCAAQQLQQFQGLRRLEIGERPQRNGKVLPQRGGQPQHVPGPVLGQRLVGAGGQLDRLTLIAVCGHRPVVGPVQPDDVGQQKRIGRVRLRPRDRVPLPVSYHRERVDLEHVIADADQDTDQDTDPRAAVGLEADLAPAGGPPGSRSDQSTGICSAISACNRVAPRALRQPPAREPGRDSSTTSMS
jgi:hypothetical protein